MLEVAPRARPCALACLPYAQGMTDAWLQRMLQPCVADDTCGSYGYCYVKTELDPLVVLVACEAVSCSLICCIAALMMYVAQ